MNDKVKSIVSNIYEGKKDVRDTLNSVIQEKAAQALAEKKIQVAKNFFGNEKVS